MDWREQRKKEIGIFSPKWKARAGKDTNATTEGRKANGGKVTGPLNKRDGIGICNVKIREPGQYLGRHVRWHRNRNISKPDACLICEFETAAATKKNLI